MGSQCQSHLPRCVQVSAAASVVSQALGELLQHVRQYTARGEPIGRYDQATDTIMNVTENIFSSMGDAGERSPYEKRLLCQSESESEFILLRYYYCTSARELNVHVWSLNTHIAAPIQYKVIRC